jgi:hypothetical protein
VSSETLKILNVSLVRPKLEIISFVGRLLTCMSIGLSVFRRNSIGMRCGDYEGTCTIFPHICALIRLETLCSRRANSCVMFIFYLLSGRVNSPSFLSLVIVNTNRYHTRRGDFLRIDFHRTNYGIYEPLNFIINI